MLFGIAWILTKFARIPVLPLWGFFLLDWSLMAALPRLEISFGPSKPPTLLLALLRAPFALIPSPWLWAIQSVGTLLVIYGFFIEPQQLIVTHRILRTIKLGAGVRLRLLHVGDLHLERITKRERELVAVVESLKPDLILFSGDILSYSCVQDDEARAQARSILNAFKAPLGVFAVAGSPPVDTRQVLGAVYRDTKIELLERQTVELDLQSGVVRITGLACTHDMMHDGAELQSLPLIDPSHYQVLLYHSPDLAPQASALGYDLQLSGHTHGGQVRLPFFGALYTSSIHGKRFEAGDYVLDRMKLYVTRGLGLEGKAAPRVRFLCPPEIVLLEITGRNEESGLTHRGERYPGDCLT
jgi:predicted MPP superfamily phosphohydrolase